jgi:hypothetical protein
MKPENLDPQPPETFDSWLVGFLAAVGIFAACGFVTIIH